MKSIASLKKQVLSLMESIEAIERSGARIGLFIGAQSIDLDVGEHYAGVVTQDGGPSYHLILIDGEAEEANWESAKEWSREAGGELPTPREQALLYANLKDQFKPEWYWSSSQHAADADSAWCQYFGNGYQGSYHKSVGLRARAVRRLPIQ